MFGPILIEERIVIFGIYRQDFPIYIYIYNITRVIVHSLVDTDNFKPCI